MATSAIPGAIDYLVATCRTLFADPIVVSDGWYPGKAQQLVMVGLTNEDPNTSVQAAWNGLGAHTQDETFDIPCVIWCAGGDTDQKITRDQAFGIYDQLVTAILADLTLGGALARPCTAQVTAGRLVPTNDPEAAGSGRAARIYFGIHCTSRLNQ